MIRDGKLIQLENLRQRPQQARCLPSGLFEHQPERQRGLDGQVGINRLTATVAGLYRQPSGLRFFSEPDRQTATLLQGGVIVGPIPDPVFGLREFMTASMVVLVWHGLSASGGAAIIH